MDSEWEIISLLNRDTNVHRYHNAVSQVRSDSSAVFGRIGYVLNLDWDNFSEDAYNSMIRFLRPDTVSRSISIDSRFLYDERIMDVITNAPGLREIRIVDPGFVINEDLVNRFNENVTLIGDNATEDVVRSGRVIPQYGVFKKETNYVRNELTSAYFVDHDLTDDELSYLVNTINNDNESNRQLSFRVYNPTMYESFLRRLRDNGLDSNVEITLLGNPLYDTSACFNNINGIVNNNINVIYDTCDQMVERYTREPFSVSNVFRSELEGGGKSNIASYNQLLNILETQERHIKNMGYSPLEAQIYAYRFLQSNYAYDPDIDRTDSIDYLTNRQLDMVAGSQTLVCEGYATLYSALMRRCGYPVFRYSTDRHVRNIARIKDPKYGVDSIGVFDPTFDGSHIVDGQFEESRAFTYFMLSPRDLLRSNEPEFMTIPSSLVLARESLDVWPLSRDFYEYMFDDLYNPLGYAITALDRMGIDVSSGSQTLEGINDFLDGLNRTTIFDEIDSAAFENAYVEVLKKENPQITQDEINAHLTLANLSRTLRYSEFSNTPNLLLNFQITDSGEILPCELNEDVAGVQLRTLPVDCRVHDGSRNISDFELSEEEIERRRALASSSENTSQRINNLNNNNDQHSEQNNSDRRENENLNDEITVNENNTNQDILVDISGGISATSIGDSVDTISMNDLRVVIDSAMDSINVDYENGEFIPGTCIRKPRVRGDYETDDQYVDYLENYYSRYFPETSRVNREVDRSNNINSDGTYSLVREQVVQDLPIYSRQESRYR